MPATPKKDPQQMMAAAAVKAQRDIDAAQAMREYLAEGAAIRANTSRLRALRLAREAECVQPGKSAKMRKPVVRSAQ